MHAAFCVFLSLVWTGTVSAQALVAPSDRVSRNVVIRSAPSRASPAVGALTRGESLKVIRETARWRQVRMSDGSTGYVSKAWTIVVGGPAITALGSPTKLHMIDVGTGLALFVEGPGWTMIYDGGSQDDAAKGPNNRLLAYLHAVRPELRTIDHLVLSHPHEDHEVLLPDVFDQFDVRNVWDSGRVQQTVGYCRFLKKASAEPGLIYHGAVADAPHRVRFQAGSCTGDVVLARTQAITSGAVSLSANSQFVVLNADSSPHADPNGNSLVIRLDIGSRRVLLMGDAEGGQRRPLGALPGANSIEGRLLRDDPGAVHADVLVVGHHGSLTSSRLLFLETVGASVYLISSGPHEYGGVVLPDPEIRDELDRRGDLYLTTVNDIQCLTATAKIGRDKDGKPGGCTNVVVTIGPGNLLAARYSMEGD
ncbi:SH3 domain-containing protein [Sphingomonas sediminicola]|uniref:MBL fold metallo-hydrolase n=1 Tax=Sphingomonas sediminicola TaxID=386874 RepID=UPI003CF02B66